MSREVREIYAQAVQPVFEIFGFRVIVTENGFCLKRGGYEMFTRKLSMSAIEHYCPSHKYGDFSFFHMHGSDLITDDISYHFCFSRAQWVFMKRNGASMLVQPVFLQDMTDETIKLRLNKFNTSEDFKPWN